VSRADYLAKIATAKEHIVAGDAFEICLTHRMDAPFAGDPFALWQELRSTSPSPFAAFIDLPEGAILSSSPERFLSIDAAGIVESRPIKGTRPRGATPVRRPWVAP
jgi:anthranilate/para-aminobenzoate synthase component I